MFPGGMWALPAAEPFGPGSDISGTGTSGKLAKFTGAQSIGDSFVALVGSGMRCTTFAPNLGLGGSFPWGSGWFGSLAATPLATPSAPTVANVGTAGATAYSYKVVATLGDGSHTAASSAGSTATGNATLTGSNLNRLTWAAVVGATFYDIYRTVGGATQGKIGTVSPVSNALAVTLDDTGLTASGSAPSTNTTGQILGANVNPVGGHNTGSLGDASTFWSGIYGTVFTGLGGSAGSPTFSFSGDATGVYLSGSHILGFSCFGDLKLTLADNGGSGQALLSAPTQFKCNIANDNGFLRIDDNSGTILQYNFNYLQVGATNMTFSVGGEQALYLDVPTVNNDTSALLNWRKAGVQTHQRVSVTQLVTGEFVLTVPG